MKNYKRRRKKRYRRRRLPLLLVSLVILAGLGVLAGFSNMTENLSQPQSVIDVSDNAAAADAVSANSVTGLAQESRLEVHFIDVGQGECSLLICDNHAMLIDAGDDSKGTKIQAYLKKQGVEQLDYLVLSHPDADHIGGAPVIITKFDIEQVWMTQYEKDSVAYEKVKEALEYRYLNWTVPEVGSTHLLGNAKITVLGPSEYYEDSNNSSLVLLVEHGENTFLFTGDAQEEAEKDITLDWNKKKEVDVLKAAHHGSKTSTGEEFLDTIKPRYAVISCGEGNPYGFPHAKPLNYLRERNIQVFRTDEQGSIIVTSDGKMLNWNCAPSVTWQVGE